MTSIRTGTAAPSETAADLVEWATYLNALEQSLEAVEIALDEGGEPVVADLSRPTSPPPQQLTARRDEVGARLNRLMALLESQRDEIRQKLSTLPARPSRGAYDHAEPGASFDLSS